MKKGFTLVELLVAVLIMTLLITMAVPMYEKTIEKSRGAEARALLKKMGDSKLRMLDAMGQDSFSSSNIPSSFTANSLDVQTPGTLSGQGASATLRTDAFTYRFFPLSNPNWICCSRNEGDTAGVSFWFDNTGDLGGAFWCTGGEDKCAVYGMKSTNDFVCN